MSETVEGEIQNLARQDENYGVKISSTWYNPSDYADNSKELKEKQRGLEVGDKVELGNVEKGYFSEIHVMEDGGAGSESASKGAPNGSEGSPKSSNQFTSKDDRINKKVAFKEAAETVRQQGYELGDGEHEEALSTLANGYYNILKDIGDE